MGCENLGLQLEVTQESVFPGVGDLAQCKRKALGLRSSALGKKKESIPITVIRHQESLQGPTVKAFIGYRVYYTSDNM